MKKFIDILIKCPLFNGIESEKLSSLLKCLDANVRTYKKGQIIFEEGDPAKYIGIILSGTVQIIRVDYYGNRSIITEITPPLIFGEAFACAGVTSLPVNAAASEDSEVMLIEASHITQSCSNACQFHGHLIFNLLKITSEKNIFFHQKSEITSKRSTREKLMTYLLIQAKKCGKNSFCIPFDRQELADYLEVDRSGLSAEISKLRHEGILECKRSNFTLLN